MKPVLSLIVPNHNHADKLPGLFDSILAQRFPDLEVLLVDDNSEIPCQPVVEAYRGKGLTITFLPQITRIYTQEARLRGIEAARGDIVGFADADDRLWGEEALARNLGLFAEKCTDILHFRLVVTDGQGRFLRYSPTADPLAPFLEGEAIFEAYSRTDMWGIASLWNKFFSKTLCLSNLAAMRACSLGQYREDSWLGFLLFMAARRYVGSDLAGYGYFWQEKKDTCFPGQTLSQFRVMCAMEEYFASSGMRPEIAEAVRSGQRKILRSLAGRMCLAARGCDPDTLRQHLQTYSDQDRQDLLLALILAGADNAEKLLTIYREFK